MNRNRTVGAALALVLVAGAIGWVAGTQITSPADAAARAEAPEPSLITVAVEERLLSADIIARGTIDYDSPMSLEVSGSTADTEAREIITAAAAEGDELGEGDVAIEIAGRPVVLLQGDLPVFRDLRPGSTGLDVLQLEQSLVRQGFLDEADEIWDNRTGAGIQSLYASMGYDAAAASEGDRDALKAARDWARDASRALADAKDAIADAGGATGSALLEAEAALASAKDAVTLATTQRTAAIAEAKTQLANAESAVANGEAAVAVAEERLAEAEGGTHPDTGLTPTALELTELEAALTQAELDLTVLEGDRDAADNNVDVVTTQEDTNVAAAKRERDIAEERLDEAQSPGDTSDLIRARDDASRALAEANEELASLEEAVGTWLPSGEVVYVETLPVQVATVNVERGDILSGAFMTVSGAEITMTIGLQESEASRLSVGDRVVIDEPDLVEGTLEGTIAAIPEDSESDRVQVKVEIPDLPSDLLGANVRVVIPVESSDGEVLVVPAAALSAVADGNTRVEVEDSENPGQTRFVIVETGLATDGVVEVRPTEGSLAPGDRVVVGQAEIAGAGDDATPSADDDAGGDDGDGEDAQSDDAADG